ncbi:ethanolamine kinase 1-like [Lineus longissimus]|uniref:ethanolamine kinase 1-like n=1 Tax=Lineus longissimus TaxID=88925 RepID=UPI002B4F0728
MTENSGCPEIDIHVDKGDYEKDVLQIIKIIRPEWTTCCITIKPMNQGNINLMLLCHTGTEDETAIVVRMFGVALEDLIHRGNELAMAKCCGEIGLGPKVYCSFNNGFCSAYLPGKTFGWLEHPFKDIENARIVAKTIARYHCRKTMEAARAYNIGNGMDLAEAAEKILIGWPVKFSDPELHELFYKDLPDKEELLEELHFIKYVIDNMGLPRVLNHGDLNPTNFVYNENTGVMTFVDYEMCGFRIQIEDLTKFLLNTSIALTESDIEKHNHSPEFVRAFIRAYLEELRRLDGNEEIVNQEEVEKYRVFAEKFYLIMQFIHMMLLPQFVNTVGSDKISYRSFITCYKIRLKYYYENKNRVLR